MKSISLVVATALLVSGCTSIRVFDLSDQEDLTALTEQKTVRIEMKTGEKWNARELLARALSNRRDRS